MAQSNAGARASQVIANALDAIWLERTLFRREKYQVVWWFFARPVLPFALELVILAPLVLAPDPSAIAPAYVFLLPWLLLVMGMLSLPFVVAGFRAFKLDSATRRNHALEHATIYYLRANGPRRLAGRAARNGFRVSGGASAAEIKLAFQQVRDVVRQRAQLPYVSRRCGSNVVTALGLALVLLLLLALGTLLFQPPLAVRASGLAAVVLIFVGMRRGIGNWIQRRFFMATDFHEVSLRDIKKISADAPERPPVYFVETIVRAKAPDGV